MTNPVAVITGANSGLGFHTASALARAGATVVLACRNAERARAAQRELLAQVPAARSLILPLDVSEPESIREFARRFAEQCDRLDVLVNNAGVVAVPLARNSAGHELHWATNYLGAFALTGMLLPCFRENGSPRIVNVGSLAHRFARLDLDDPSWERAPYNEWKAYARSKLALLCFTMELNRRLQRSGSRVLAVAAHPGFAATEVARNSATLTPTNAFSKWLSDRIATVIPQPAAAAQPIVHAACGEGVRGGDYYGPSGCFEIRGAVGPARLGPRARDEDLGRRLWALSETLTGVRYLADR